METPGTLLREARKRHGVSQRRLAIRAGTTQSAISRIEKEHVSPSVDTLRELLDLMGEDLTLGSEVREWGIDRTLIREQLHRSPSGRLDYALALASQLISISPNVREEEPAA